MAGETWLDYSEADANTGGGVFGAIPPATDGSTVGPPLTDLPGQGGNAGPLVGEVSTVVPPLQEDVIPGPPPGRHFAPPVSSFPVDVRPIYGTIPAVTTRSLGATDSKTAGLLGFSILAVGAGAALGARHWGGMYGGVAGGLYGGAIVNTVRAFQSARVATDDAKKEALVSGTFAAIGAGLATYVLMSWAKKKEA